MRFGIQFFPDVGPDEKSAESYWREALYLVSLCDELGFDNVRTVEHYFHPYGGYSPNPIVFLAAAAMRTAKPSCRRRPLETRRRTRSHSHADALRYAHATAQYTTAHIHVNC